MTPTEPVDTAALRRDYRQASRLDVLVLCDEVDRLTATLDRVRALHRRDGSWCITCNLLAPCPTIRTLDAG